MAVLETLRPQYDVVVVGAGFAGMYMLYRLRQLGLSVRVFEAGSGVGGTWYWNRYPGARVDVESLQYSYSFSPKLQQDWEWTEFYASQSELLGYANHVADRFELRSDIQFGARVVRSAYDESTSRWNVETEHGDRTSAKYLVAAVGCLSATNLPDFDGLNSFNGQWYHTSRWPHEGADLQGKRVGIVGTGSTGIQAIPMIAEEAGHLFVFQRTPNYSLPCKNKPMDPGFEREWKRSYDEHRSRARVSRYGSDVGDIPDRSALSVSDAEREQIYEDAWGKGGFKLLTSFNDIVTDRHANETAAAFVREKIRSIVKRSEVAELLAPKDYPIGAKRICMDTHYYETYNRDNVTLIDVKESPIVEITAGGLRTTLDHYDLDVLVFATGFDAMTGPLFNLGLEGKGGLLLKDKWAHGPRTYLGVSAVGFPNLFMVTGPGSPSVLSNMMTSIEQHVDFIGATIGYLEEQGIAEIEPEPVAEDRWAEHVNELAEGTLFKHANSWYLGANIPGKPRVFMPYVGGVGHYRMTCDEVAASGYEGFALRK